MATVPASLGGSFLVEQFRSFYAEVVAMKAKAHVGALGGAAGPAGDSGAAAAGVVSTRLVAKLDEGAKEAAKRGGTYGSTLYEEARYVMAALGDEVFVRGIEWEGRDHWRRNLLETRLFKSYVAGDRIYENIDRMLEADDPINRELAAVYLLALTLGFRGKYYEAGDDPILDNYRERLYQLVTGRAPGQDDEKPMIPAAYASTLSKSEIRALPYLGRWITLIVLVAVGFLAAQHFVWVHTTSDVRAVIEKQDTQKGKKKNGNPAPRDNDEPGAR